MNKLTLATSMIGLALLTTQAQAGSPMMDDPILLSARGESGSNFKAEILPQIAKPYKAYRDRLGYGSTPQGHGSKHNTPEALLFHFSSEPYP